MSKFQLKSGITAVCFLVLSLLTAAVADSPKAYADSCLQTSGEFNAVVYMQVFNYDGTFAGYAPNFDFSVRSYAQPGADLDGFYKYRHNSIISWNGNVATGYGADEVDRNVRWNGGSPLYSQGNRCDPDGTGGVGDQPAYAFRTGDGTSHYFFDPAVVRCDTIRRDRANASAPWGGWYCAGTATNIWVYHLTNYNNKVGGSLWGPNGNLPVGSNCINRTSSGVCISQRYKFDEGGPISQGGLSGSGSAGYNNNGSYSLSCLSSPATSYEFQIKNSYQPNGGTWLTPVVSLAGGPALGINTNPYGDEKHVKLEPPNNIADINNRQAKIFFRYRLPPPAAITPHTSINLNPVEAGATYTTQAWFTNSSASGATVTATWRTWQDTDMDYANGGRSNETSTSVNQAVAGNKSTPAPYAAPAMTGVADGTKNYVCTRLFSVTASSPAGATVVGVEPFQTCRPIAKAPAFAVYGGDARAGGYYASSIGSPCSVSIPTIATIAPFAPIRGHSYPGGTRSSVAQYGVFTPGQITNIMKANLSLPPSTSRLLFGSTGWVASSNGYYLGLPTALARNAPTHCLPSGGDYAELATVPTHIFTSPAPEPPHSICAGDCVLNAGERRVIFVRNEAPPGVKKTVRIEGNITHSLPTYPSIRDIPQFVLVIGSDIELEFAEGVTEVNAIILTRNKVRTCNGHEGVGLTKSNCTVPLHLKGTLITAGRIYPFRTAGFNTVADTTYAEVFQMNPGTLLADYARARGNPLAGDPATTVTTRLQTELPPRF